MADIGGRVPIPIQLPSLGLYYRTVGTSGEPIDLCPEGRVQIVPWSTAQEEALVTGSSMDPVGFLKRMTEDNILLPQGMPHADLLVTDQFFLLIQLRIHSLMSHYAVARSCAHCGKEYEVNIDLSALDVRTPEPNAMEPFELMLPKRRVKISIRSLRVGDEFAVDKMKKSAPGHKTRFRHALRIQSVEGKTLPLDQLLEFVDQLIMLDLRAIEHTLNKNESGLILEGNSVCAHCSEAENGWSMGQLEGNFFRPGDAEYERAFDLASQSPERNVVPVPEGRVHMVGRNDNGELAATELLPNVVGGQQAVHGAPTGVPPRSSSR